MSENLWFYVARAFKYVSLLGVNPTKSSNKLKRFVGVKFLGF